MKHLKKGRKFSRTKDQREAMLKTMLGNLIMRGKINTTLSKAKELKKIADRIISQSKKVQNPDKTRKLSKIRLLKKQLPANIEWKTLQNVISKLSSRQSGFSRIVKTGNRMSDGAQLARLEIIFDIAEANKEKSK